MSFEIRTADLWPDADFELRAADGGFEFEGYAAVFNLPSVQMQFPGVGGGRRFREVIEPGAFTDALAANPDVSLRYQHNMMTLPLGRTTSGTMELTQNDRGLHVRASLPDNEWGRPFRDAVKRKDVRGMSFRFQAVDDTWSQDGKGRLRTLRRVNLGPEVSLTDYPAYPDTMALVRAFAETLKANPEEVIADFIEAIGDEKLSEEAANSLVAVLGKNADMPVLKAADVQKMNQQRERLNAISAA
ncbi:MAG: HK97 family phage prohead protease [Opitutales bacterium]